MRLLSDATPEQIGAAVVFSMLGGGSTDPRCRTFRWAAVGPRNKGPCLSGGAAI
jgi:hypothetical protein